MDDFKKALSQARTERNIEKASDKKILRRQLELLAKYSYLGIEPKRIPEISQSMVSIYRELFKAKSRAVICAVVLFSSLFYIVYCVALRKTRQRRM